MKILSLIYSSKLNCRIVIGVLCAFMMNSLSVYAMDIDTEQDGRSLYKKIMSVAYEGGAAFNLKYLRTLKPNDEIDHQELFKPQPPEDTIRAAALCVAAGDAKQLAILIKRLSTRANFNYSQEKKERFATMRCEEDGSQKNSFIQKHLYTKNHLNPNDPVFYVLCNKHVGGALLSWPSSSPSSLLWNSNGWYSLAHLAVNPCIFYYGIDGVNGPTYLPPLHSVSQEDRFCVIDILAKLGTDFNCFPYEYQTCFLDTPPVINSYSSHLLSSARCDNFFFTKEEPLELSARAVLYGANVKENVFLQHRVEPIQDMIDEYRKDLLQRAFNQVLNEEKLRLSMKPTPYVRQELDKLKNKKTQRIIEEQKDITSMKQDLEDYQDELPAPYTKEELLEKESQLSVELEKLNQLNFSQAVVQE